MYVIRIHSFSLIAQKLWKELIIQTCHPVVDISQKKKKHTHTHTHTHKKKPKFEKAVIFVMNFFPKRQTYNYSVPVSFMPSNKSVAQKV